ncbi:MAG: DUF4430 domain-containing protein [Campylobacterota bacterium]|nr:DUF4430 domain-containing protein [Campylobacterota bacterium]
MRYLLFITVFVLNIYANELIVTVIYENDGAHKIEKVKYTNGETALDVLKKVSEVQSYNLGKYKFVSSIDGKKSIKGRYGWFYTIDGKDVNQTASTNKLNDNKTMQWVYKREACN